MTSMHSRTHFKRSSTTTKLVIIATLAVTALMTVSFDSHRAISLAQPFHAAPQGLLHRSPAVHAHPMLLETPKHRGMEATEPKVPSQEPSKQRPNAPLFSFAVLSDTHDYRTCRIKQGRWVGEALKVIRRRRPAFVVGVGDLIAGGGDCKRRGRRSRRQAVDEQLAELNRVLLERLPMPFIPVAGNHDLSARASKDPDFGPRSWHKFWRKNIRHSVPALHRADRGESFRFTYRGVGVAVIGYYGTEGLHADELAWVRKHVRPGDLVFRHVNPFGVSCISEDYCGVAMTDEGGTQAGELVKLLKTRRTRALFSGHTHAFYEGDCDGLRFINTGSLGARSMEYLPGWEKSPYRKRQAFVWVDVLRGGKLRVTFYVWNPEQNRFAAFDPRHFPRRITTHRVKHGSHTYGLPATCVSRRRR